KLPIPSMSALMTGGITGAIGLGGTDIAMQQLEGLESFKALTGMDWTQTLTTSAAAKGVGLGQDQISRLIQRLDTNIGKLTQGAVLGATAEGTAVNLGFGREGVDPTTLRAVMNSLGGVGGASLAMKSLGLTPSQLTGMDAQQQLAIIAERLGEIKNNTLKTAVTQELFGRGTDTAFLLQKFTQAEAEAQKNLPKGLAKDLQMTLGGGGDKSMIDLQENMFYLEVEMSASLLKMVPSLNTLVHYGAQNLGWMEKIALGLLGGGALEKMKVPGLGGESLAGLLEKGIEKGASSLWGKLATGGAGLTGLAKYGGRLAGGAGDLAGYAADLLPGIGFTAGGGIAESLAFPSSTANDTSALALAWQKMVAPHAKKGEKFTQLDTEKAITEMATLFGLNPKAMLADSYAEATLNPYAHNKSGATGAFQFLPSTFAADTKQFLGGSLPTADASNPYIAAFIAAAAMAKGGIGGKKQGDQSALLDMIMNFERPDKHPTPTSPGVESDLSRGAPFLQTLDQDLTSKTGPKIKAETDTLLLALVTAAEKHSKDFSTATDKGLLQTETYLRTHKGTFTTLGTDLLKGLEQGLAAEEPTLIGQAKRIAGELEQTIRAALKTHSPSEMTAEIGADLMAGLALGMERATPGVAAVAGRQALLAAGPLAAPSGVGGAASAAQPIILHLTIELDGKQLTQVVQAHMHENVKLLAKFN
ncbi:MAG: transglycosylase SLT domain-containing protein, partial [Acidobacteriota bacterium]|nr:transglycosylase SLT domain-containing protein [Acidobacteriota bacterium]